MIYIFELMGSKILLMTKDNSYSFQRVAIFYCKYKEEKKQSLDLFFDKF